jgi:phospholipid transport system substrate-binding protein
MQSRLKILVFFAILCLPLPAYSDNQSGVRAERFIDILSSEALKLATNTSLSSSDRRREIANLLNQGFDMPWIARFVLGRNWRLANSKQRKEYLSLFQAIVEHTYSRQFTDYSGQKISVVGHKIGKRKYIFVLSRIYDPNQSNINISVNWRLIPDGSSFKIVDVVIEGVSMGVTQRNEYASVLQRNGNSISALIEAMRQSLAKLEKRG